MSQTTESFEACLDILRCLQPHKTESNLDRLVQLLPGLEVDLRNAVDVPSGVLCCPESHREFLTCDYNRVGQAYRSPWSGVLVGLDGQTAEQAEQRPERLQAMEVLANKAFDSYRQLYYEGGISSAYFWLTGDKAFGAAILIKKAVNDVAGLQGATWDAIHVAEVEPEEGNSWIINMTSTVLLDLQGAFQGLDEFRLGGSLTRQHQSSIKVEESDNVGFVAAIGRAVEDMEGRMRSSLQEIHFGKTHDIVNELRPATLPEGFLRNQQDFRADLTKKLRH